MEAKQGSFTSSKGHGKRGTRSYQSAMEGAFYQARQYIQLLETPPSHLF
jgi:hypothetical protein